MDVRDVGDNEAARRNDGIGNGENQDNRRATVRAQVDGIIDIVDPTDRVLAKVLTHLFVTPLPESKQPLGITAACIGQSFLSTLLYNTLVTN